MAAMEEKQGKTILLIIDPQNDFHPGGSLGIEGANEDSVRIAELIRTKGDLIDDIYVTLDSHHRLHLAHGVCWKNAAGESPQPFTLIKNEDIQAGTWVPRDESLMEYVLYYTQALEKKGRFVMCIWPEHCLIGTPGHAVVPVLNEALQEWVSKKMRTVNYVMKGTNCMTEMYSALCAEVPIPDDPSTKVDPLLIDKLNEATRVLICGEAKSHCVNYTMRDLADNWKGELNALVLLDDCCTAVPGFEADGEKFVADMKDKGCTICPVAEAM